MEWHRLACEDLSPESTVTSLLSSSGHLRSSLRPPDDDTTFRYRDTVYESASEALDAYIADYERCQQKRGLSPGSLVLQPKTHLSPRRRTVNTLRNKDVLRERLTERELDFLSLPVSSLRHRSNRDRTSMTTEELLSIPIDGSEPVTHTSAFIQALLSQSAAQPVLSSSDRSARRPLAVQSSSCPNTHHPSHRRPLSSTPARSSRSRARPGVDTFKISTDSLESAQRAVRSHRPEATPPFQHWIQHRGLREPPPDPGRFLPPRASRTGAPSWVAELEAEDDEHSSSQVESRLTLRDLRLQLAEQICRMAAERRAFDTTANLSRGNKIESLIQKADRVLTTLSQGSGGDPEDSAKPESSGAPSLINTEDLLHDSSQHTVGSTGGEPAEPLTHRGVEADGGAALGSSSIWKQPGPVEALKQMLFRLQAVETQLQQQQQVEAPAAPTLSNGPQTPAEQRRDEEEVHSSPSLQRALYHLGRLKVLLDESREKSREREEDKDEDEGRFSASSVDRPDSCPQEAS